MNLHSNSWHQFTEKPRSVPALLSWDVVSKNLAWGPIILLGGGFAMADATKVFQIHFDPVIIPE